MTPASDAPPRERPLALCDAEAMPAYSFQMPELDDDDAADRTAA